MSLEPVPRRWEVCAPSTSPVRLYIHTDGCLERRHVVCWRDPGQWPHMAWCSMVEDLQVTMPIFPKEQEAHGYVVLGVCPALAGVCSVHTASSCCVLVVLLMCVHCVLLL
eukprot:TRINITY_DN56117_c0_g1_i1.p1 TRINITY_DN56117_c0_g1~~TRINITY_DN56117_c0_g1_i1.p1  ORF type:complete len:110 (+),score=2.18 TRINITY_DN56117_c0_g1_i1:386-715(+)